MELTEAYTTFKKSLYGYIMSKISNTDDAQDILQDVFMKMTTHFHTLSNKDKIQHWLYGITRNAIIDYYRVNSTKKNTIKSMELLPDIESVGETTDVTKGLDTCLMGFIKQLPEKYKAILIDSELEGISQKELAEKYQLAYPTLRSRVQRGRLQLHEMLVGCCSVETDTRGNILDVTPKKRWLQNEL